MSVLNTRAGGTVQYSTVQHRAGCGGGDTLGVTQEGGDQVTMCEFLPLEQRHGHSAVAVSWIRGEKVI